MACLVVRLCCRRVPGILMTAYAKAKGLVGMVCMQDDYDLRRVPCKI